MIRLFNLDLHISVIADVKEILERLFPDEIKIDSWSISGHTWVFNQQPATVDIINENTWRQIDEKMIQAFRFRYKSILENYDGFIVTHTPVFCRIFESFGKPIFMINSCRYDQPYCFPNQKTNQNDILNQCLKRLYQQKLLIPISNNRADRDYLYLGTEIQSMYIPSICRYPNIIRDPLIALNTQVTVACDKLNCIPHYLYYQYHIASKPMSPYSWNDLMQRKALIYIPYEASTMSLFEYYTAGVPLILPTKQFYRQLILDGKAVMASYQSVDYDTSHFPETTDLDWWLDRCDFYSSDWMEGTYYFNSWEDLAQLLQKQTFEIPESVMDSRRKQRRQIEERWKQLVKDTFLR